MLKTVRLITWVGISYLGLTLTYVADALLYLCPTPDCSGIVRCETAEVGELFFGGETLAVLSPKLFCDSLRPVEGRSRFVGTPHEEETPPTQRPHEEETPPSQCTDVDLTQRYTPIFVGFPVVVGVYSETSQE